MHIMAAWTGVLVLLDKYAHGSACIGKSGSTFLHNSNHFAVRNHTCKLITHPDLDLRLTHRGAFQDLLLAKLVVF
jgi:hypothetical protein